jgi:hypothetical protein
LLQARSGFDTFLGDSVEVQSNCKLSDGSAGLAPAEAAVAVMADSLRVGTTFELPWDIGEWVDRSSLASWIWEEVQVMDWHDSEPAWISRGNRPQAIVATLVFAYATRVFDADEIVGACRQDGIFRYLCEERSPFTLDVRRFRRENRSRLITILDRVLTRAVQEHYGLSASCATLALKRLVRENAVARVDIARHMETDE